MQFNKSFLLVTLLFLSASCTVNANKLKEEKNAYQENIDFYSDIEDRIEASFKGKKKFRDERIKKRELQKKLHHAIYMLHEHGIREEYDRVLLEIGKDSALYEELKPKNTLTRNKWTLKNLFSSVKEKETVSNLNSELVHYQHQYAQFFDATMDLKSYLKFSGYDEDYREMKKGKSLIPLAFHYEEKDKKRKEECLEAINLYKFYKKRCEYAKDKSLYYKEVYKPLEQESFDRADMANALRDGDFW